MNAHICMSIYAVCVCVCVCVCARARASGSLRSKVSKVQVSKQTEYIYVYTYMYVCAYIDVCVCVLYWEKKNDFNNNKKRIVTLGETKKKVRKKNHFIACVTGLQVKVSDLTASRLAPFLISART
jgi:hypothetical protein